MREENRLPPLPAPRLSSPGGALLWGGAGVAGSDPGGQGCPLGQGRSGLLEKNVKPHIGAPNCNGVFGPTSQWGGGWRGRVCAVFAQMDTRGNQAGIIFPSFLLPALGLS